MVLVMLSIQRSLIGLTDPLVVPGRTLIKRGSLLKSCRRNIQPREFFLFSDCLVYASPVSGGMETAWQALARGGAIYAGSAAGDVLGCSPPGASSPIADGRRSPPAEGGFGFGYGARIRTRTSSAAALEGLPSLGTATTSGSSNSANSPTSSFSLEGQQLQFRNKFPLQDCMVVGVEDSSISSEAGNSLRYSFEIRTPDKSFAVYASRAGDKEDWLNAIRDAREEFMTNKRTLRAEEDSIEAKRDRRRSQYKEARRTSMYPILSNSGNVQAGEENQNEAQNQSESGKSKLSENPRRSSLPISTSNPSLDAGASSSFAGLLSNSQSRSRNPLSSSTDSIPLPDGKGSGHLHPQHSSQTVGGKPLRVLEDYNAPVWVPDNRAENCIRCSESFGIFRRRHHCRLCGQVVCWECSQRTFLIASYEEGEDDKPARACDTCYDNVFPEGESPLPSPDVTFSSGGNEELKNIPRSAQAQARQNCGVTNQYHRHSNPIQSVQFPDGSKDKNGKQRTSVRFDEDVSNDSDGKIPTPSTPSTPNSASNSVHNSPTAGILKLDSSPIVDSGSPKSGRPLSLAKDDAPLSSSPSSSSGQHLLSNPSRTNRPSSLRLEDFTLSDQQGNVSISESQSTQNLPVEVGGGRRGAPRFVPRSSIAGAQLFDTNLMPQVQVATSGTGRFRLITPRLTTPESEFPPSLANDTLGEEGEDKEANLAVGDSSFSEMASGFSPRNESRKPSGTSITTPSYFSPRPGSTSNTSFNPSLSSSDNPTRRPSLAPGIGRPKPLSAAARLSTIYPAAASHLSSSAPGTPNRDGGKRT